MAPGVAPVHTKRHATIRLLGNLEDSIALPHLSVAKEVQDKLGLPLWLAAKYAAVVFLLHVRFHVSAGTYIQTNNSRVVFFFLLESWDER